MRNNTVILIKNLAQRGLMHMFGANVFNKIISFSGTILLVRILSKGEYGVYAYVQNFLSFFLLLNGLGVVSGLLQYGSVYRNSPLMYAFFKYGLRRGVIANIILAFGIGLFGLLFVKDSSTSILFVIISFIPVFTIIYEIFQIYNLVLRNNKFYSLYTSLNTVLVMGGTVVGAYFLGVKGIFAFTYIALLGCIGAGMVYLKRGGWIWCDARVVITKEEASEFNRFSLVSMFNNGVSFLVYIIDVFLIGVITEDMNVLASYKTATLIPFALTFIPSTIMTFVYPYFANHQNDKNWVRNHYMKLLKYCLGLNLCISLFLIFFSKLIVQICFGKEYLDCVSIFIVLAIGYFFTASLRIPGGNVLASLGKIKVNFYITVAMGLFNIIADVVLIYWMGSIGAAISTLSVFLLSGLVSNLYLYRYLLSK